MMAALKTKPLELASRSVHIKMHPTPRSLTERREVLRVLERFGEVTMFRSYKYHPRTPIPNAFLSMFASSSSAKDAQSASPIRYTLISSRSGPDPSLVDPSPWPGSNSTPASTSLSSSDPPEERVFELHITASEFDHLHHVTSPHSNPLHGPFTPIQTRRSFISHSLAQSIPESTWSRGLRDWETDAAAYKQQRDHEGKRDDGSSRVVADGADGGGSTQVYQRTLVARNKKRREKDIPAIMKGLKWLKNDTERQEPGRSSAGSPFAEEPDLGAGGK